MDAYNAHDLDGFMALYDSEIEIFTYPDVSLGGGLDHLRGLFEPMFTSESCSVEIVDQIVMGDHVISDERVTVDGATKRYVSIYEVAGEQIKTVRFVR
jgi:hypothetical protein